MGFLNHATNNIIIDAVLTERGRELLSKNDSSFNISSFTFGDDEVDYTLIKKYGNPIGKEKIEKNTPIFEANPNENIAIKSQLISFPSPLKRIKEIPVLQRFDDNSNSEVVLFDAAGSDNNNVVDREIKIKNFVSGTNASIDTNLSDDFFYVRMHGELLKMTTATGTLIETDINNIDTYQVSTEASTQNSSITNQREGAFSIFSNDVVSADSFESFSMIGDATTIKTSVQVIGGSSGAKIIIPVKINKSTT